MERTDADIDEIRFDEKGLVPAVVQEAATGRVLMLAYMTKEALEKTIETGRAHYYSRSRKTLWKKGETSGNFQDVRSIRYDCDADAILLEITQTGVACHTGEMSCFYRRLAGEEGTAGADIINELFRVILERKGANPEKSYVASLYEKGFQKIASKIHEEAAEFITAGKGGEKEALVHEAGDLWFHTMVMLAYRDADIKDVLAELSSRFGTSGIEEKKSRKEEG